MSGRGRGRGRGRGGAPPSGAKLLLMRSAQESGLGDHNLKSLTDITKPALFPDLIWNYQEVKGDSTTASSSSSSSSRVRSTQSAYLINKTREIDHRIQTSSHWVRPSQTQVDVVRYQSDKRSHRFVQTAPDMAVLEQMGKNLAMDDSYTPAELVPVFMTSNSKRRKRSLEAIAFAEGTGEKKPALEELEKKEIQRKIEESKRANVLDEDGEGGNLSDIPPEDEEEEVEDYTMNYYASEDESDGGGEAEATF